MLVSHIFFQKLYISKIVEECYVYSKIKKGERCGIITYGSLGSWVDLIIGSKCLCVPFGKGTSESLPQGYSVINFDHFQTFHQDLRV
jgi:hypothetical protein